MKQKNELFINNQEKKERQSSIELLRIICIIMIVFSHAAQYLYGGTWWNEYQTGFSFNFVVSFLLGMWGQISVATFVVISSYFLLDHNKIHSKRIIMLIFQTIFLSFFGYCVAMLFDLQNISFRIICSRLYQALKTPFAGTYWFITTYLFFYFLTPLMQFVCEKVSETSLKHISTVFLFGLFGLTLFIKSPGGTLLEFCSLYFIVAYTKKYKENVMKEKCVSFFLLGSLFLISVCLGLNLLSTIFHQPIFVKGIYRLFVHWNPLLILLSINLFYVFKYHISIKSKRISKVICSLSKTSLGVYILHENSIWGRTKLWNQRFRLGELFKTSHLFAVYFIGLVFFVFVICVMIEYIRMKLFDDFLLKKYAKRLDHFCDKFDHYYVCTFKDQDQS